MLNPTLLGYSLRSQTRKNMNSGTAWQLGWDIVIYNRYYRRSIWPGSTREQRYSTVICEHYIITWKNSWLAHPNLLRKGINYNHTGSEPVRMWPVLKSSIRRHRYRFCPPLASKTCSLGKSLHQSIMCNGNTALNFRGEEEYYCTQYYRSDLTSGGSPQFLSAN